MFYYTSSRRSLRRNKNSHFQKLKIFFSAISAFSAVKHLQVNFIMQKLKFIFLFLIFFPFLHAKADEIKFVSQPEDSLFRQTYTWQQGNQFRPLIILDGEWDYRTSDKDAWQKVSIPASCDYWGEIIFQRSFVADSTLKDYFFRLVCQGINYYCEIFINNKFIGSHAGG